MPGAAGSPVALAVAPALALHAVTRKLVNEGSWGMLDADQYVNTGYVR